MPPVHFLLVDDLEENLLSLEALLRRENLVLLKARSGDEALELLLRHDVALALVDVQMPGLNGFELAELMRGNERTKHIPIIFVTAGTADGQRRFRGYEAGAVDFIQKPIETDILRSKADVFFQLYRQRQQIAAQFRAVGEQQKREIMAAADKEVAITLATAQQQGETTRGEGDALRTRIFAQSFGKDPGFAAFYRSMQAYEASLGQGDTTMVLSPDSAFFRYFDKGPSGR